MRTPRLAAISRAQAVTIAPGEAEISPPGGTSRTSSAVTMSFMRGLQYKTKHRRALTGRPKA